MKKWILLILNLICAVNLLGCAKRVESCPAAESITGAEEAKQEGAQQEEASVEQISSDMLSQEIYDALRAEWDAWNAKDDMQKAISSHIPGHIYKQFDTWEACEEFLGFKVFNPLEDSEFEMGTYVGMSEGFNEAPRFYVSFYGTSEGQIEWIHVESGYRDGEIRITVNAQIFVDTLKENMDSVEPLITEDSGERYVASEALLAHGPITYSIRVIGEPNMQTQVKETLEKVLPYFTL